VTGEKGTRARSVREEKENDGGRKVRETGIEGRPLIVALVQTANAATAFH